MGRPFRSVLAPLYADIVRKRKEGETWEAIAQWTSKKLKQPITRQAVQDYFKRHRRKLRVPMGMEGAPVADNPRKLATLRDETTTNQAETLAERKKQLQEKDKPTHIFDDTNTIRN